MKRAMTITAALLLGLTACGGDDASTEETGPAPTLLSEPPTTPTTTATASEPTEAADTTTEPQPTTTSTTAAPATTTTEAATTTTTAPPAAPVVYSGTGDDVIEVAATGAAAMHATHDGQRNFIITPMKADMQSALVRGAVNHIGPYDGTTSLASAMGDDPAITFLQVRADGAWTIELLTEAHLPTFDGSYTGTGDQVVVYTGAAGVMHVTHDGARNFIVNQLSDSLGSLSGYINEIGPYDGRIPFMKGPTILTVMADGNWTITPA